MHMSFFDKMKASIGIGAAKVDTKLEKDSYKQGETVKGTCLSLAETPNRKSMGCTSM
ncbi:sporulation protein [[Brevibacterium] frigoritolerans]|uniref:Sporulation protein n=1 Tax=Peribacillus frigoritolerans TaxID=450367 RepID=A0A941J7D9_9BACI|nr:sporulation protein [Peribacillus frigoritolerans]